MGRFRLCFLLILLPLSRLPRLLVAKSPLLLPFLLLLSPLVLPLLLVLRSGPSQPLQHRRCIGLAANVKTTQKLPQRSPQCHGLASTSSTGSSPLVRRGTRYCAASTATAATTAGGVGAS